MLLFRSDEHVGRWCESRRMERGAGFSLEQMWSVALRWYTGRASPGWKRRTPEESQAILAEAGLSGEFWNLQPAR